MAAPKRKRDRKKVLWIWKWPPRIERLSDAEFVAFVRDATQLTKAEALANPRLVRDRLREAIKRHRQAARKRRSSRRGRA